MYRKLIKEENLNEKSWKEFKDTGLLLFINQILHIFGWVIVIEIEDNNVIKIYPARTKFRGFNSDSVDNAYKKITKYMFDNSKDLMRDIEE